MNGNLIETVTITDYRQMSWPGNLCVNEHFPNLYNIVYLQDVMYEFTIDLRYNYIVSISNRLDRT